MNYNDIPERPLDPPEDNRVCCFHCELCGGAIREGDDYYDIESIGPCCEECIKQSKRYDAEPDYPEYEPEVD